MGGGAHTFFQKSEKQKKKKKKEKKVTAAFKRMIGYCEYVEGGDNLMHLLLNYNVSGVMFNMYMYLNCIKKGGGSGGPKSIVELGYMCPRGLLGPPAVTLTKIFTELGTKLGNSRHF